MGGKAIALPRDVLNRERERERRDLPSLSVIIIKIRKNDSSIQIPKYF